MLIALDEHASAFYFDKPMLMQSHKRDTLCSFSHDSYCSNDAEHPRNANLSQVQAREVSFLIRP